MKPCGRHRRVPRLWRGCGVARSGDRATTGVSRPCHCCGTGQVLLHGLPTVPRCPTEGLPFHPRSLSCHPRRPTEGLLSIPSPIIPQPHGLQFPFMERYRIHAEAAVYYLTYSIVEWLPVFISESSCKIIT